MKVFGTAASYFDVHYDIMVLIIADTYYQYSVQNGLAEDIQNILYVNHVAMFIVLIINILPRFAACMYTLIVIPAMFLRVGCVRFCTRHVGSLKDLQS